MMLSNWADDYLAVSDLAHKEINRVRADRLQNENRRRLHRIILQEGISTRFEPIVALFREWEEDVLGYEALSGCPGFPDGEALFAFARRAELLLDLERTCRNLALSRASASMGKVFINSSVEGLWDKSFDPGTYGARVQQLSLAGRVVIEITERTAIGCWREFRARVSAFRDCGFEFALDDVGAGYSSLEAIAEIQPNYLKADRSLISGIQQNPTKKALVETLLSLSEKIGAPLIAEGVERRDEYDALRSLGVQYAQGYLFADHGSTIAGRDL